VKIDLGTKEEFSVTFNGADYQMSAPTVKQAQVMRNRLKDEDEVDVFIDLLSDLGMPKKVAEDMSTTQLLKLSEGLLGSAQGK
jgi:hypothetical protein